MNIKINANDIMMALGYNNTSASKAIYNQACEIVQKANSIVSPKYVHKLISIKKIDGADVTLENGDTLTCSSLARAAKDCTHVLLAIMTVGQKIDDAIGEAFTGEEYLDGMMLDASGTSLVANYSRNMWQEFINLLDEGVGMTKGFSPGSQDFEIKEQSVLFKNLDTDSIGVTLSDSYLMTPHKSISVVYGVGKGIETSCVARSCKLCPKHDCMMRDTREVEVKVHTNDGETILKSPIGIRLIDLLQDNNIFIDLPCNGRGTCGACGARFKVFVPKPSESDLQHLSQKQLDDGYRLTCQVKVEHPLELFIETDEMEVMVGEESKKKTAEKYAIAIDIGTTTVVCHLIDADNGDIIDTAAGANKQRAYGADVASRILHEMSNEDGKDQLHTAITGQLNEMIQELISKNNVDTIEKITAVGNTVMTHILLGYPSTSLGTAPYTPVSLDRVTLPARDIAIDVDADITVLECIASYVGSDVAVGAVVCDIMENDEYSLLIDLGTNGEIMLANKDKAYCCATAAGPAFEAANIHCGMSGLPGAVSQFSENNGEFSYKTVGDKSPIGICGSGVLDITATLFECGIVDMTGRMIKDNDNVKFSENTKEYFEITPTENSDIIFTAKDVREIQLAKAAVAAGVHTLVDTAGIKLEDIKKVYLAGGFGNYMDIASALRIGLISDKLEGRIIAAGNTAAKGSVGFTFDNSFGEKLASYVKSAEHIELSMSMIFQNYFVEYMGF